MAGFAAYRTPLGILSETTRLRSEAYRKAYFDAIPDDVIFRDGTGKDDLTPIEVRIMAKAILKKDMTRYALGAQKFMSDSESLMRYFNDGPKPNV